MLNYVTAWMGGVFLDQDTFIHMVESIYCPPVTHNIVNRLYLNTKLKVSSLNKEKEAS